VWSCRALLGSVRLLELREVVEKLKVLSRLGHDVEALEASSPPPVAARQTVNVGAPQEANAEPSAAKVSLLPASLGDANRCGPSAT
jgi:hypothetical protein